MTNCSLCHGAVVAADSRTILDRTRHVDGQVDVALPTNCKSSCHGGATDAAPLPGTPGAGAHRTHLDGTPRSRAVPCAECHLVPTTVLAVGHLDTPRPAEARFSGVATAYGASPSYAGGTCNGTACHGAAFPDGNASGGSNTAPTWARVDGSEAACGTCHGLPPPGPHPLGSLNPTCNACHKNIAADNATFLRPELHVDGKVTFELPP
jgi:predicted CxxxxCH...CXXCH cytochrome family protein